jgi:uncharacterized OB-fold protein
MDLNLTYIQFIEALKKGELLGLECSKCHEITVPPRSSCSNCSSREATVQKLRGQGEIETFTVIRVPPEPHTISKIVCVVKLTEGPRLMGNLLEINPDEMEVSMIGRKVRIGCETYPGDKMTGGERVAINFYLI